MKYLLSQEEYDALEPKIKRETLEAEILKMIELLTKAGVIPCPHYSKEQSLRYCDFCRKFNIHNVCPQRGKNWSK